MIREIPRLISRIILLVFGWLFVAPLAYVVPKQRNLAVFVGQGDGRFADNVKYLYLHVHEYSSKATEYFYLMNSKRYPGIFQELREHGFPVRCTESAIGVWTMLRASVAIFDHGSWTGTLQLFLLLRARKIQLWHGSGIKAIGQMQERHTRFTFQTAYRALTSPLARYDLVLMNSRAQQEARAAAFSTKSFYIGTHPRVDCLFRSLGTGARIGSDGTVLDAVKKYRDEGMKTVLYAPTFRARLKSAEHSLDYEMLRDWVQRNNVVWINKSHPGSKGRFISFEEERILEYDRYSDIYPLFKDVDVLITDYSSIYTDFLLLDRPICFFVYDLDDYLRQERMLLASEKSFPGPRVKTFDELLGTIERLLIHSDVDPFEQVRKQARDEHFEPYTKDGTQSLWSVIETQYLRHAGVEINPGRNE